MAGRAPAPPAQLTRARDALTEERLALPWEAVTKASFFEGPKGMQTLPEIFDGRSQLVVYHATFDPSAASPSSSWTTDAACENSAFWADNLNGIVVHLNHRDVTMIAVSRAPYEKLAAYQRRMGWTFPWYSSGDTAFNFDD